MRSHTIIAIGILAATAVAADPVQVHRCTVDGVTSFSDEPCADDSSAVVTIHAPPSALTDAEIAQRRRQMAADQNAVNAMVARQKEEREAQRQRMIQHRRELEEARWRAEWEAKLNRALSELHDLANRPRRTMGPAVHPGYPYP
jgi:hypothetical protein